MRTGMYQVSGRDITGCSGASNRIRRRVASYKFVNVSGVDHQRIFIEIALFLTRIQGAGGVA